MIDMPDHVAEKQGNRVAWMWPLVTLLGITLSVVAGMASYGYTTAQAEKRFADVVDYVATQSLSYDAFNSAYAKKKLNPRYGDCRRGGARHGARRLSGWCHAGAIY